MAKLGNDPAVAAFAAAEAAKAVKLAIRGAVASIKARCDEGAAEAKAQNNGDAAKRIAILKRDIVGAVKDISMPGAAP